MERHAPLPDRDDFQRVLQIRAEIKKLVEQDISKASSHKETYSHIENQILKLSALKPEPTSLRLPADKEIGGKEAQDVLVAIPAPAPVVAQ